jgi:hypothetical protein
MSDKKLIEKSMKAPKGRNLIACGIATEERGEFIHQALKGRNIYVALTGLAMNMMTCALWRVPQAITLRRFRAVREFSISF